MKALKWIIAIVVALVAAAAVFLVVVHKPRPEGAVSGEAADALAREVQQATGLAAWEATGAVRFEFGGRQTHLWDRQRGFARVAWGDTVVLLDTYDQTGIATVGGQPDDDPALVEQAWKHFINDTFWLYPFGGLFDAGVTRATVELPPELPGNRRGLLIGYGSGGVTPGDAYLWHIGADGKPIAWQMWVEILPVGGVEVTWDGWTTLATGVEVSTKHEVGPMTLQLTGVEAASSLVALEADDPFTALAARRGSDVAGSQPTK